MAQYEFSSLSILVVDDFLYMRQLMQSILSAFRVGTIHLVANAKEAIDLLQRTPVDLAFVDWVMDPIDGLEFVRKIRTREDSPNPYLPIVMLSAHTEIWRVEQARDAGANAYLSKPVSPRGVFQRISSLIDNPRTFIRTAAYHGPDRRRKDAGPPAGGAERRAPEAPAAESA